MERDGEREGGRLDVGESGRCDMAAGHVRRGESKEGVVRGKVLLIVCASLVSV